MRKRSRLKLRYRLSLTITVLSLTGIGIALGWPEPKLLKPDALSGSEENAPGSMEDETVDVEKSDFVMISRNPWQPPHYPGQEQALGWSPDVFSVPAGLEQRVAFWVDIYTKYSTDEGVLHDSQYVPVVYGEVDFAPIMKDSTLSERQ